MEERARVELADDAELLRNQPARERVEREQQRVRDKDAGNESSFAHAHKYALVNYSQDVYKQSVDSVGRVIFLDKYKNHETSNVQRSKRLSLSVLACAAMFAGMLISCNKEEAGPQEPVATAEVDVTPRVRAFVAAARSEAQTKDNAYYSADSAEWYIEAGLNFSVATAWVECNTITLDSAEVALPGNADGFSQADVQAAFNALHAHVTGLIVADVNHLVLSDATVIGSGAQAIMKVYLQFGSGYEKALNTSFTNSWLWGDQSNIWPIANCGCGTNPGSGRCAYKQIEARINQNIPLIHMDCFWHSIRAYGVNSFAAGLYANYSSTSFPTGNPAAPYKIFRCVGLPVTCEQCWSPALMGTYTQYAWDMLLLLKPNDRQAISCTFESIYSLGGDNSVRMHQPVYRYGKKSCLQP